MTRRLSLGIVFPSLRHRFGAERLVLETAQWLAQDAEVTVYSMVIADGLLPDGVRGVSPQYAWSNHKVQTFADWLLMPRFARRMARHDAFIGMNYQGALGAAHAARRHGVPFVYHCTEPPRFLYDLADLQRRFPGYGVIERSLRRLDQGAVAQAARIVAISEWTQRQVQEVYGRPSSIVYPGIDAETLRRVDRGAARDGLGIPAGMRLYLSLSKLHPRKRIETLIETFLQREPGNTQAALVIAGDGPDRERIETLVRAASDPRIRMVGYVSEEDRVRWLRAADVFLFNGRDEPFGLAPLEAKSLGIPVLPICPAFPIQSPRESTSALLDIVRQAIEGA